MIGFTVIFIPGEEAPVIEQRTRDPSLAFLQRTVGGYIEAIPHFSTISSKGVTVPCIAYCNEEGKLKGLPTNWVATMVWHDALKRIEREDGTRMFPRGLLDEDGVARDVLTGPIIVVAGDREFLRRHCEGEEVG